MPNKSTTIPRCLVTNPYWVIVVTRDKTTGCISTICHSRFHVGGPVSKILSRWCRFTIVLFFFLTVYALFLVAFSVVVREPLFAWCVVFCWVSRDTDDKTTFMCMLCCSMVRCTESVERRRDHGVDCRRVAPSVNGDHDLFFGLFTAEQGCICWNVFFFFGNRGVTMTRSGRAV